jgi:hypothetical protein
MTGQAADLLVRNARLVATCDGAGRELAGGWVAVTGGLIAGAAARRALGVPARSAS